MMQGKSRTIIFVQWLLALVSLVTISACDPAKNSDTPAPGNNYKSVTLSGSVSVAPNSVVDNDVNDTNAPYLSNDNLNNAQDIPNPVSLGGYVNLAGQGTAGRSYQTGDSDDYYRVHLFASQSITLSVSDFNLSTAQANRVAMFLLDVNGTVIQHTSGQRQTDLLTVNSEGIYYLHIQVFSGASSYTITIGLTGQQEAGAGSVLSVDQEFVPGEVIVEYKHKQNMSNLQANSLESAGSVAKTLGMSLKSGSLKRNMLLSLETDSGNGSAQTLSVLGIQRKIKSVNEETQLRIDTIEVVKALRKRPDIVSARLNYIRQAYQTPNDEYYSYQWHYPQIGLPQAWDITTGSSDVIVAVIDTGVLLDHPDLQGQFVAGYDFIRSIESAADGDSIDDDPFDVGDDAGGNSSFHGTHVSGTIAAASDNGTGVSGVAWGVRIMPLRALGRLGGTDYDIEQAVRFAARLPNDSGTIPAQKADVINLSLGGPTNSTIAPEAFRLAREEGVIIVAAAGNEASDQINYPASLNGVVSVSATNINNSLASYSNFGNTVDIAAPGGSGGFADINGDGYIDGILSTAGREDNGAVQLGYTFFQGTSMASPHIAGVAALMRSVNNSLTPNEFDQLLENGDLTVDLGAPGRDDQYGYGMVDAYQAVTAAASLVDTPVGPLPASLEVQPTALNFGALVTSLDLDIGNAGDGELVILQIDNNASGWLSVSEVSVDNNGIGRYLVQVDRSSLPQSTETYSATITITSSSNTVNIPVIMQVFVEDFDDNTGFHYALLRDFETQAIVQKVNASLVNGEYRFTFYNVGVGNYTISAGTDNDNDGVVCESADACGTYLMPSYVLPVAIGDESGNRAGIDFETSLNNVINAGSENQPLIKLKQFLF